MQSETTGAMRLMNTTRRRRTIAVALVVFVALGSAYQLGRTLTHQPLSDGTANVRATSQGLQTADQPPPSPSDDIAGHHAKLPPDEADQGQPRGTPGHAGPSGSQSTTGTSSVALTFDDGPDPRYTPQVLAVLREHHVTATFCLVGENAQAHPDLVRAIVAGGHTLCNHTWRHDITLGDRAPDRIRADMLRTSQAIHAAAPGVPIVYFRQPGGAWTHSVVAAADDLGMIPLHWTVDPADWKAPGATQIAGTVTSEVRPGSIVLLHDAGGDRQGTVNALRRILPTLSSRFHLEALPNDPA